MEKRVDETIQKMEEIEAKPQLTESQNKDV